jgi:GAF domain-containing protein/HAMP domain-containing protein
VSFNSLNLALPYIAWLIALVELILGLYVLILNAWHSANRHTSALILLVSANSFAIGSLASAGALRSAYLPAIVLAATTYAIQPLLLLSTVALLKPEWLTGRRKWLWWPFYAIVFLPAALIILDMTWKTNFWFTGINPNTYTGGYLILDPFTQGKASAALQMLYSVVLTAMTIALLFYCAAFNRKNTQTNRKLAWILLVVTLLVVALQAFVTRGMDPAIVTLITSAFFALAYSYACFSQMNSERRMQRGSLQLRLTALVLAVSVPLMVAITLFVTSRAGQLIGQYTLAQLLDTNQIVATRVNSWQEYNAKALQWLVQQPDITSMNSEVQIPALENMARAFPNLSLISITDLDGNTIARSDKGRARNYRSLTWFQEARSGKPLVFATVMDSDTGKPIEIISAPIKDPQGEIIGVGMFTTLPETLNQLLRAEQIGDSVTALVFNQNNQLVASNRNETDPVGYQSGDLRSTISKTRSQTTDGLNSNQSRHSSLAFRDAQGSNWQADINVLDNDWAVVMLTPETALMAGLRIFQRVSWLALFIGAGLLFVLSWLTIRQAVLPVRSLTETATAIARGDLTQVAQVETEDEIGLLARTFNSMTSQLRELITNLEHRVSDRTRDIERRALQLQVAADVAREASLIQEPEQLLDHTVQLISKRFNFYHAGIFLIDDAGKSAVLRAASSEGGQRMLARGHKLDVGKVGIVGYVAGSGTPRIAHDVGTDAVFFNNPDLPQTRSELALPLNARGEIIGVLDVQSTKPAVFTEGDVTTLQILADQVALAIDNSRLLSETNQALQELRNLYALQVGEAWRKSIGNKKITYQYNRQRSRYVDDVGEASSIREEDNSTLRVPVIFRGQSLGSIILKKDCEQPGWSPEEIQAVSAIAAQFSLALENARLLEETQRRAERERRISEITAKIRSSNDPEVILQTAAAELRSALRVKQSQILLNPQPELKEVAAGGNGNHGPATEAIVAQDTRTQDDHPPVQEIE